MSKKTYKRVDNGIASNNENTFNPKLFSEMGSEPTYSKMTKAEQARVDQKVPVQLRNRSGDRFPPIKRYITNYKHLLKGRMYHVGTGNYNHGYVFKGTFIGLDEKGNAQFRDYSQLDPNKGVLDTKPLFKIPPLEKQTGRVKRHIFRLENNALLPSNVKGIVRGYVGGRAKTRKRSKKVR